MKLPPAAASAGDALIGGDDGGVPPAPGGGHPAEPEHVAGRSSGAGRSPVSSSLVGRSVRARASCASECEHPRSSHLPDMAAVRPSVRYGTSAQLAGGMCVSQGHLVGICLGSVPRRLGSPAMDAIAPSHSFLAAGKARHRPNPATRDLSHFNSRGQALTGAAFGLVAGADVGSGASTSRPATPSCGGIRRDGPRRRTRPVRW